MSGSLRVPRLGSQRWVVSEAQPLRDALSPFVDESMLALAEGRVFVDKVRVTNPEFRLRAGQQVEVFLAGASRASVDIVGERGGVIAVCKPAGIATEPDHRGSRGCLLDLVGDRLRLDSRRLHALSRLDLGVSGVVLVATSRAGSQWVTRLRDLGKVRRRYVGLAGGRLVPSLGHWSAPVTAGRGAPPAETHYRVVANAEPAHGDPVSLVALEPSTGRKHQLRIHLARAGAPLLGDRQSGGVPRLVAADARVVRLPRIALHCARVELDAEDGPWRCEAPVPTSLGDWWTLLGGDPDAWGRARRGGVDD